jgi:hypothetical protein
MCIRISMQKDSCKFYDKAYINFVKFVIIKSSLIV